VRTTELGALDEHVDVRGDFDGDAVDRKGTVSPLPDSGECGVGRDWVTGMDAHGQNAPVLADHGIEADFALGTICFGRVDGFSVGDPKVFLVFIDGGCGWLVIA
jgi:hypothetical protein